MQLPRGAGVYIIRNLRNGKFYIGSSCNLRKRQQEHWRALRANCHVNDHLQAAWNRYGEPSFVMSVLLRCSKEQLLHHEQDYIDATQAVERGYNIMPMVGGGSGYHHTRATRCVLRDLAGGAPLYCVETGEQFDTQAEAARKLGVDQSNISAVLAGRIITAGGYRFARIGEPPPPSIALQRAVRRRASLRRQGRRPIYCPDTKQVFSCLAEAEKTLGVHHSNLKAVLDGTRLTAGGYRFAYAGEPVPSKEAVRVARAGRRARSQGGRPFVCAETGERFTAQSEASRCLGVPRGNISKVLHGERQTAGGYHFKYVEEAA